MSDDTLGTHTYAFTQFAYRYREIAKISLLSDAIVLMRVLGIIDLDLD